MSHANVVICDGRETYVSRLDVVAPSPAEARRLLTAIAPKAAAALAKA